MNFDNKTNYIISGHLLNTILSHGGGLRIAIEKANILSTKSLDEYPAMATDGELSARRNMQFAITKLGTACQLFLGAAYDLPETPEREVILNLLDTLHPALHEYHAINAARGEDLEQMLYHVIEIHAVGHDCDETLGKVVYSGTLEQCIDHRGLNLKDTYWTIYEIYSDRDWQQRLKSHSMGRAELDAILKELQS